MAGRYRALLIGNSTYPADEHNLQPLRGPVKDIAALNRALVDRDSGLFSDVDVTLLAEVTSSRALRTLSRFFAEAGRDDVLLLYFSGHGKIDQSGRLHLCMQDTETTDLLSTAVSSVRISEFAEESSARNVVIVLDCCHAGAFRGGDFGDAVAGVGRYVLTSCRSTQLANDATVDNGTSFFTQHLVEGLLGAAEPDADGYISFSTLYTYVDGQLRQAGKQIPQRRVNGDGDLRLSRRAAAATPSPAETAQPPAEPLRAGAAPPPPAEPPPALAPPAPVPPWRRRRTLIAAGGAVALVAGAVVAAVLLSSSGSPDSSGNQSGRSIPGHGSYTAAGPWRLRVDGTNYGNGCVVTLTHAGSGDQVPIPGPIYGVVNYQVAGSGSYQWQANDSRCLLTPLSGSGTATLPFLHDESGDTDAFAAPAGGVTVTVTDPRGSSNCELRLYDPTNGQELDLKNWSVGQGPVTLNPNGRPRAYVFDDSCVIRVSAP
jgi:hypothetical protein